VGFCEQACPIAKLKGGDDMTMELLSKSEIARENLVALLSDGKILFKFQIYQSLAFYQIFISLPGDT
jgi:hypothetical protein